MPSYIVVAALVVARPYSLPIKKLLLLAFFSAFNKTPNIVIHANKDGIKSVTLQMSSSSNQDYYVETFFSIQ